MNLEGLGVLKEGERERVVGDEVPSVAGGSSGTGSHWRSLDRDML